MNTKKLLSATLLTIVSLVAFNSVSFAADNTMNNQSAPTAAPATSTAKKPMTAEEKAAAKKAKEEAKAAKKKAAEEKKAAAEKAKADKKAAATPAPAAGSK